MSKAINMNRRLFTIAAAGLACCFCLAVPSAVAWNSQGHRIVGLIAYDRMNDATRAKVNELPPG
ncbi:MAG: hypothetical protein WD738_01210 [Pirellulales bacterium]